MLVRHRYKHTTPLTYERRLRDPDSMTVVLQKTAETGGIRRARWKEKRARDRTVDAAHYVIVSP